MSFQQQMNVQAAQSQRRQLGNLAKVMPLVSETLELIHSLQRERGLSNLCIGELVGTAQQTLQNQSAVSQMLENDLQGLCLALSGDLPAMNAGWWQWLADAPGRAERAVELRNAGKSAAGTQGWTQLISEWIEFVLRSFEIEADDELSQQILCLLHLVQAKELSGQARAWGCYLLVKGNTDDCLREQLAQLHRAQISQLERAGRYAAAQYLTHTDAASEAEYHSIYTMLSELDLTRVPSGFVDTWFAVLTRRMDAMHRIELSVLASLAESIQLRLTNLAARRDSVQRLSGRLTDNRNIEFTLHRMIRSQNDYLAQLQGDLQEAKTALSDRKVIDQAKGLLMQHHKLSEAEAYRRIRDRAMQSQQSVAVIARNLVKVAHQAERS